MWIHDASGERQVSLEGYAFWPLFSANGRTLCFRVTRSPATGQTPSELWMTDLDSGRVERLPKVPSLALRLARVAEGSIDIGLVAADSHDWDLAGADLILHESGGRLTDLHGGPVRYNQAAPIHGELVAAAEAVHAETLAALRR